MITAQPSKRFLLLGCILVAGLVAILTWRTDSFRQQVFPKAYWSQRVAELERSIRTLEFVIRDLRLELAKKALTATVELAQEANIAAQAGMDPHQAANEAADRVRTEITGLRDLVARFENDLEKTRAEIDLARSELAKHK